MLPMRRVVAPLAATGRRCAHIVQMLRQGPNVEALRLYRDILRECRYYDWVDEHGRRWSDVLRESTRREFEQARYETDPEIIGRLLVVGRDALMQSQERFAAKRHGLNQKLRSER
jgi:hypothetical protein